MNGGDSLAAAAASSDLRIAREVIAMRHGTPALLVMAIAQPSEWQLQRSAQKG
jgi:hypothetical protein